LVTVNHAVRVGDGSAASGLDFFHDLQRGFAVGAFSLGAATQVVDHDLGPMLGEQQGMRPADAAAGAGDDNDLVFKTDVAHGGISLAEWEAGRLVSFTGCRPASGPRPVNDRI